MLVKAVVGFSGTISMHAGETRDIPKGAVLSDLLRAGHVVQAEGADKSKPEPKGKDRSAKDTSSSEGGGLFDAKQC